MFKKYEIAVLFFLVVAVAVADSDSVEVVGSPADTIYIFGDRVNGILNLPTPPNGLPYLINGQIEEENKRIILPAGEYNISWNGGIEYESVDTTVNVEVGRISNVNFRFRNRTATIYIETEPEEAKIFINGKLAGVGIIFGQINAGRHSIHVSYKGYHSNEQEVTIFPDRVSKFDVVLEPIYGDDSMNRCLEIYGTYEGCPEYRKIDELRRLGKFLGEYLNKQPFSIEVSAVSLQYRMAGNKDFHNIISLFNDGSLLGANYRGFSVFNKLWIAKSFVIASAEYGQGFSGLKYEKPYEVNISHKYNDYYLIYNEYTDVGPSLHLRSYSGQIGVRAGDRFVSVALLWGYQREKMIIDGVYKKDRQPVGDDKQTGRYTSIEKNNHNYITTFRATVTPKAAVFTPTVFAELSLTPVSGYEVSNWVSMRTGVIIPWWSTSGI